jgi:ATPase subunit of ABC transporter with duplicated ATPase domains
MPATLHLPDGTNIEVSADHPIVLLGPNGVGKTRFAVDLAQRNRADRISANRFIGLTDLPRQADSDLKSNATSAIQRQASEYWNVHNEYTFLMSQVLEEDKSSAQKYRNNHLKGEPISKELSETRLREITTFGSPCFRVGFWHWIICPLYCEMARTFRIPPHK